MTQFALQCLYAEAIPVKIVHQTLFFLAHHLHVSVEIERSSPEAFCTLSVNMILILLCFIKKQIRKMLQPM